MAIQGCGAADLKELLAQNTCHVMPCCFDALSARLIEQAGFPLTFMSGFSVAAARAGLPDTGLLTVSEMLDQGRSICDAINLPVIGDGDTGHGNAANVHRTMHQFARAGFAGIMLEDQLSPKRCGHTGVKAVVEREQALERIRAAVQAREQGADLVIIARTDARSALAASHGETQALEEALWRLNAFADLGADVLFLEAPRGKRWFCRGAGLSWQHAGRRAHPGYPDAWQRWSFVWPSRSRLTAAAFAMKTALSALQSGASTTVAQFC